MECDRSLNLMIPACNWTLAVLSPVLSPTINSFRLTAFSWQSKFIIVMEKDEHPSLQASQSTRPTPELRQWTLQIYPMTHNATRSPPFMRTRILVRRISRDPFHFLPPLSTLWYVTHHLDTWVFRMCCRNNESIVQSVSDYIEHLLVSIHLHNAHEYWALLCKWSATLFEILRCLKWCVVQFQSFWSGHFVRHACDSGSRRQIRRGRVRSLVFCSQECSSQQQR